MLENFQLILLAPTSFFAMNIFTYFLEQRTPFPQIPFCYCTFNTHFNNLPLGNRRTNILYVSNHIADRTLQVAGFSNFLPLKSKANGKKANVYLSSLMIKVLDHGYVLG
jgi:hypothetical protein